MILSKVLSLRHRWLCKNLALFLAYGMLFSTLRSRLKPVSIREHLPDVPSVTLDYNLSPYNSSKVALLIENRPSNLIAPTLMHFMAVVPPDWKFRFMGSIASLAHVYESAAVRQHVRSGKLELTRIPRNMSTAGQEAISKFLTNRWVIEHVLKPAEWLLVFQTDSMICAKHPGTLDSWLEYSWVGAPWHPSSTWGGNGGLSLRRVSHMLQVVSNQQRQDSTDPEDVWLTERLGHLPHAKTANGSESMKFSVEGIWYDTPLGYHTGGSGKWLNGHVWGTPEKRNHIWDYCPEMKMTLDMDLDETMRACPDQE